MFSNHLSQFVFIMNGYLLPELLLVWSHQTIKRSCHIPAAGRPQISWGNNQTHFQDLVSDSGYQRQGRLVDLQTAVPWQDKCPTTTERARHSSRQGKGSIRPDLPLAANLPATSRRTYTQTQPQTHTHTHTHRDNHEKTHKGTDTPAGITVLLMNSTPFAPYRHMQWQDTLNL